MILDCDWSISVQLILKLTKVQKSVITEQKSVLTAQKSIMTVQNICIHSHL